MKRSLPVVGLVSFLFLVPVLLYEFMGAPYVPDVNLEKIQETLSGPFLSVDSVIRGLGLLTWVLWAYLVVVVLLRSAAVIALQRGSPSGRRLIALSSLMGPAILLRVVDVALGAVLLIGPVASGKVEASQPMAATAVVSAPILTSENGSHAPLAIQRSYVVRPGDSLWRIAERELGSGDRWREIFALNEGRSFPDGRTLKNPRLIRSNWILWLPGLEAAAAQPPNLQTEVPVLPTPAAPIVDAGESDVASEESQSQAEAVEEAAEDESETARRPVISLPSGVAVVASFASGVLASHAVALLRRRRRYRPLVDSPEPPQEPRLVDELRRGRPDESVMSLAARELSDECRQQTGRLPRMVWAWEEQETVVIVVGDPIEELRASERIAFSRDGDYVRAEIRGPFEARAERDSIFQEGPLVAIARSTGSAHHLGPIGSGTVAIVGERAEALTTALVLGSCAGQKPDDVEIYLIGDNGPSYKDIPHLRRAVTWDESAEALREIQTEILARARAFADAEAADIWAYAAQENPQRMPAILIVVTEPPAGLRGAVEGIASQCSPHGLSLIALGWRPSIATTTITAGPELQVEAPFELADGGLETLLLSEVEIQQVTGVLREAYSRDPATHSVPEPFTPTAEPPPAVPVPPTGEMADSRVTVDCLGPMIVKKQGEEVEDWRARSKELLAYLVALRQGVPEERLLNELWPNAQKPKRLLRDAIFRLRSVAHEEGDKYSERFVLRESESVCLESGIWSVDAWRFEDLIAWSERLPPDEALPALREALGLYKSEFCDGSDFVWVHRFRERYRRLMTRASVRLCELLRVRDMLHESLAVIDSAIRGDAYCEDLHRRAISLEVDLGRRWAAEERYQRLVVLLAEELGEEPEPETQALAASILNAQRRDPEPQLH